MRKNYKGLPKKSDEAGTYKPVNVKLFNIHWSVFLFKMKMLHLLKCCTDYHKTFTLLYSFSKLKFMQIKKKTIPKKSEKLKPAEKKVPHARMIHGVDSSFIVTCASIARSPSSRDMVNVLLLNEKDNNTNSKMIFQEN